MKRSANCLFQACSRQALSLGLAIALVLLAAWSASAAGFRPGVAVLTFRNTSVYGDHLLARRAADQLALDLGATGQWRVVDRIQTDRACRQRDMQPPYAVGYMQELGHALGADLIFFGEIKRVDIQPATGAVKLVLFVEAVDQVSGQSVFNLAQAGEARGSARTPQPTDVLVGDALAAATKQVAAATTRGTGLLATVAGAGDGKVVQLKLPAGAQVTSGQRFLLYRAVVEGDTQKPGRLIAALMVTDGGKGACHARVLAASGDVHSEDIAVSIGQAQAGG